MTTFGYFLSSEEHGPRELVEQAQMAQRAGFEAVAISDHFHPWMDSQGQAPFVWSTIGGIAATTDLQVTTAVTCPILRTHPAIVAQAAATSAAMLGGRFRLGVGTGERLNEHVLGQHWPPPEVRRDMLREAIEVMRDLWKGDAVTRRGEHYTVETARLYTSPPGDDVPVLVSAFGTAAAGMAAEVGDGLVTASPDRETLEEYRKRGGAGPSVGTGKVCWAPDEDQARKTVHRLWAASGIPGEAMQELAVPAHFEQAADLVTPDMLAETIPCGPDPEVHVAALRQFVDAGYDEVFVSQIGDDQAEFFEFWSAEVLPRL